jgi:hypothetical protein
MWASRLLQGLLPPHRSAGIRGRILTPRLCYELLSPICADLRRTQAQAGHSLRSVLRAQVRRALTHGERKSNSGMEGQQGKATPSSEEPHLVKLSVSQNATVLL